MYILDALPDRAAFKASRVESSIAATATAAAEGASRSSSLSFTRCQQFDRLPLLHPFIIGLMCGADDKHTIHSRALLFFRPMRTVPPLLAVRQANASQLTEPSAPTAALPTGVLFNHTNPPSLQQGRQAQLSP